jgi:hypothetical protein
MNGSDAHCLTAGFHNRKWRRVLYRVAGLMEWQKQTIYR